MKQNEDDPAVIPYQDGQKIRKNCAYKNHVMNSGMTKSEKKEALSAFKLARLCKRQEGGRGKIYKN